MKTFEERKEHAIWRMEELDRSKKGSVDKPAIPLIQAINTHPDMYTTSSCSGRIVLLHEPENQKKNQYEWLLVTHERADPQAFTTVFTNIDAQEGTVWLRMQTAIIHVACRDIETAQTLLEQFSPHGWKRSGIFSTANDIMVELLSVEGMDAPIIVRGDKKVDEDFITTFIQLANEKLDIVHDKLAAATKRVQSL